MTKTIRRFLMTTAVAAIALVPAAGVATLVSVDAAWANNGNGNGNGGGGGNGRGAENRGGGNKPLHAGQGNRGNGKANRGGKDPIGNFLRRLTGQENRDDRQAARIASKTAPEATVPPAPRGKPTRSMYASELKGMNAMNANINAFLNASPDSRVGLIRAYYIERIEFEEGFSDLGLLEDLEVYRTFVESDERLADFDALIAAVAGGGDLTEQTAAIEELLALDDVESLPEEGLLELLQDERDSYISDNVELDGDLSDVEAAFEAEQEMLDALQAAASPNEVPGEDALDYFDETLDQKLGDIDRQLLIDAGEKNTEGDEESVADCEDPEVCEGEPEIGELAEAED